MTPLQYIVQPLKQSDESFLWEMLYQALYVPEGYPPFPKEIIKNPEIAKYVHNWGSSNDIGFIAIDTNSQQPFGAVWLRILTGNNRGYGYIDDATPELTIAILPEYRNKGVGTGLLAHIIEAAKQYYSTISLSVSKGNPALRLYQRMGFEVI